MVKLILISICLCLVGTTSIAQQFTPLLEAKETFCIEWGVCDKISSVPSRDYKYTRSGSTNYVDPSVHLGFASMPYVSKSSYFGVVAGFDASVSYDNSYSLSMIGVRYHNLVGGFTYALHAVPDPRGDFKNRTGSYRRDNAIGGFLEYHEDRIYFNGICEYTSLYTYHSVTLCYKFPQFHEVSVGIVSESMKGYGLNMRYYLHGKNSTYLSFSTLHVTPLYRNETEVRDGFELAIHSVVF